MNFSIRTKLSVGFTVILLLLISISIYMTAKLAETNDRLGNLVNVSAQKIIVANEILNALLEEARQEKNIILEENISRKDNYKMLIRESLAKIDKKIPELEKLTDTEGKKALNDFKTLWTEYLLDLEELISLAYKNETEKAFDISGTKGFSVRNQSVILLNQLIAKNKISLIDDKKASDASYSASINTIVILILLSILIAFFTAYNIIKIIGFRIGNIAATAQKIASREYLDEKIEIHINDELLPILVSLDNINSSFREISTNASSVAAGDYSATIIPKSDKDILGKALQKMTRSLRHTTAENEKHIWLSTGMNQLSEQLRGDQEIETLTSGMLVFLCRYINAAAGAVYLSGSNNILELAAGYPLTETEKDHTVPLAEGLARQAATEQKPIFTETAENEAILSQPAKAGQAFNYLMAVPFVFETKTLGVIEMASAEAFSAIQKEFILSSLESIAISIESALARRKIQLLLEETQVQSEELQSQQEELRQMNEELEEQTQSLKQQQEELQVTNEELEEQTQALELKNREMKAARMAIEQKNIQIEANSKYKSEFLANMSHELRTPLNSLLILSKDLSDNKNKNLTADQVESAEIIYNSGHDLLNLINEVLDLSKIEAGKMAMHLEKVAVSDIANGISKNFRHLAEQKNLKLNIIHEEDLPETIETDSQRLDQVLKNLMSNAIKFTEKGAVTFSIKKHSAETIAIEIHDTGIGIRKEKQESIFEAFQQADGGTSRKYGGTGLGLSISRELINLLGATLTLESEVNTGTTFTLLIPVAFKQHEANDVPAPMQSKKNSRNNEDLHASVAIPDDRTDIKDGDPVVLIIEDDLLFASILLKLTQKKGFKGIVAASGEDGLSLAENYIPGAIIMDMNLPGINGEQLLEKFKLNPELKHIPVHIISGEDRAEEMIKRGAVEYFRKPVQKADLESAFDRIENLINRKMKNLLIVEPGQESRQKMCSLIGSRNDINCIEAATGQEALAFYKTTHIDCIVLDIDLSDMNGFSLIYELEKIKPAVMPPVIVYTSRILTKEETEELQKYTETIIIKGAKSEDRLSDETALFLQKAKNSLPESKHSIPISNTFNKDEVLNNKKIVLADDDMRNIFALSKILRERGMEVLKAENGKVALEILEENPSVDMVLMDIMMPEMDGYEAMQMIRKQPKFNNLPIIALTAKAMKEDRQKCIDAGANDYITKPVDIERLLSLMRVWLSK